MSARSASVAAINAIALIASSACHKAPTIPPSLVEIVSGCAGGFSGGGRGTVLYTDAIAIGKVYRWQRLTAGSPEQRTFVRNDSAFGGEVFRRLNAIDFHRIDYAKQGNMTCFVRTHDDSGDHTVSWPSSDEGAPKDVRELFDRLQAAVPNG